MLKPSPLKRIRFTQEGYEKLKKDYEELKKQRPPAVEDLRKAREMGDLKENGYYKASRAKLSFIDSRLHQLTYQLRLGVIVDETPSDTVGIGSVVVITDGEKKLSYELVGDVEANPSEKKISLLSPIGKALSGKRAGDRVSISVPQGIITYQILSLK